MKKSLLLIILYCVSEMIFAQAQSNAFKMKHKSTVPSSTSFKPIVINGQTSLKSAKKISNYTPFSNIGSAVLNMQTAQSKNKIILKTGSNTPIYIEHSITPNLKSAKILGSKEHCFEFLNAIKQDMHIINPSESFSITKIQTDNLDQQHIRLAQKFKGIKVYNSDFYVHFTGSHESLNGKYAIINESQTTTPKISIQQALQIAINDLNTKVSLTELTDTQKELLNYYSPQIDTVIVDNYQSLTKYSLTYHIIIRPNFIDEWYYFVNAENGNIIEKFNNTKSDGPATALALDLNGFSRTVNTYLEAGFYSLIDVTEPMFNSEKNEGMIVTLDAQNSPGNKYVQITSPTNNWNDNPTAVSAHFNSKQAYLYFKNTFNRNSINGLGGTIYSFINVTNADGSQMDNAFWSDKIMCYGNGDTEFSPLAGGLDVAAHEMAHGVTQNSAALEYKGESGAINESMSDIFGTMVDRANWFIGEDVTKTSFIPSGHLRDMSNPHNGSSNGFAGWQPMHTNEMYLGTEDNGGVHTNSGISNYAYYLYATAISKEKAEQVYYRALTNYLTKSSQFLDLRIAIEQSAKDLYGDNSNEVNQAKKAFDAVGIYEETQTDPTQTYPVNPGQDYLLATNTDPADVNSLYRSTTNGSEILPLATSKMLNKASVVDNGSVAVFVSDDNNIHSITLDPNNPVENIISSDGIWQNVAVSKDGNRMAAITNSIDTSIYVYDFISNKWAVFPLYNPSTEGGPKKGGVLYADAIEFDHTGEYLIYDAYNVIRSSATDSISYWDIGIMNVWDNKQNKFGEGTIAKLFGNLPDSVSVGDPVFSKNSPNIIAFDYLQGNNNFAILGLNIETSDVGTIALNNTVGYPSFSKSDNFIAYSSYDNSDQPVIATVSLDASKISSTATPLILINGAQWPVYYATGSRVLGIAPKANFSASYKAGKAPLTTTFFDQSTNEPTSWEWTFESGTPSTSTSQNPTVTYSTNGTYNVTLKATNSFGNNTVTKTGYIVISDALVINENIITNKINAFPNPTTGMIEISIQKPMDSDYKIEVFNIVGTIVKTVLKHKTDQSAKIDLSDYSGGLYVIRIQSENKSLRTSVIKE